METDGSDDDGDGEAEPYSDRTEREAKRRSGRRRIWERRCGGMLVGNARLMEVRPRSAVCNLSLLNIDSD